MNLLDQIKNAPTTISFSEVITHIDSHYESIPTRFLNGTTVNEAGQNNGSCKIFFFAKLQNLSPIETLILFGDYYRKDVLQNPDGTDHQNIRNFIKSGWGGIKFDAEALILRWLNYRKRDKSLVQLNQLDRACKDFSQGYWARWWLWIRITEYVSAWILALELSLVLAWKSPPFPLLERGNCQIWTSSINSSYIRAVTQIHILKNEFWNLNQH